MKFYSFQIVIEKEAEDEGYFAHTPNVPGCFSNGKTIEEAKRNIRQAIERISRRCWPMPSLSRRMTVGCDRLSEVLVRHGRR